MLWIIVPYETADNGRRTILDPLGNSRLSFIGCHCNFFITYLLIEAAPLWKGIFRFIAFLGLIGVVFSFLRLRDGQKKVQIELLEEQLKITYYRKRKMLKEELFERSTIKEIYSKEINSIRWLPLDQKAYEFFITFTDTENRLGLFEYSGRNIHFSKKEAEKIDRFLDKKV